MKMALVKLTGLALLATSMITTASAQISPDEISGLSAWYKADNIVAGDEPTGGTIAGWYDSSGNGKSMAQSDSRYRPTYVSSSAAFGNMPLVRLDGSNDIMITGFEVTGQTIFALADYSQIGNSESLFSGKDLFTLNLNKVSTTTWRTGMDKPADIYLNSATPTEVTGNFTLDVTASGPNLVVIRGAAPRTDEFEIGGERTYNWRADADIAEIIIYDRALTQQEINDVGYYLQQKYSLTNTSFIAITGQNPADDAINVAVDANLVATFNQNVMAGASGNIELWKAGGLAPVETFDVSTSSRLTFNGSVLTIDPTNNLEPANGADPGVEYYILIDDGAIVSDPSGKPFSGISDTTIWNFVTDGAPALTGLSPADDATNVSTVANLVATFSEPIVLGATGDVTIRNLDTSTDMVISLGGSDPDGTLTADGNELIIDPAVGLAFDDRYAVRIGGTVVKDASGNPFAGFSDDTTWNFTTKLPDTTDPELIALEPSDDAVEVPVDTSLVATFNEPIALKDGGTITITDLTNGSSTVVITLPDGRVSSPNGDDLSIDLGTNLDYLTEYEITISSNTVEDLAAIPNAFAGIASGQWTFTTILEPGHIYSVTYDGNGSDGGEVPIDVDNPYESGDLVIVLGQGSMTRAGYTFDGWNTDSEGYGYALYEYDTFNINTSLTLYAQWIPATYSVTYDGNGSDGGSVPTDGNSPYDYNATVTVLGNTGELTLSGSTFAGWNTRSDGNGVNYAADDSFAITGDVTLYARWTSTQTNTFANWIAGYEVGGKTGLTQDPDGDGSTNAEENYFGTDPSAPSVGLVAGTYTTGDTTTFTFTHPLNSDPATDLTAGYRWSKDLATFYNHNQTGDGTTVEFTVGSPVGGIVTVTARISGTIPDRLFVKVQVESQSATATYADYASQNGGSTTDPTADDNNNGVQDGVEYAFYEALGTEVKLESPGQLGQVLWGTLDAMGTPNNPSDDHLKYAVLLPASPPADVTYRVYASSVAPGDSAKTLLATCSSGSWTLETGVTRETGPNSEDVIVDTQTPSTSARRFVWLELEIDGLE